jgi:hypothetical protein
VQRFKLSSPYYNYLLGLLVVYYCIAEPIYRIVTGTSIMNLDEQPGLAPFDVRWLRSISLMLIWYPSYTGVKSTQGRTAYTRAV